MIRNVRYLLLIPIAISAGPGVCAPAPVATPQQAVAAALAYCRALGVAVSAPPIVTAPQLNRSLHRNWRPRWSVKFDGQVSLQIADNGTITNFDNEALAYRLEQDHTAPGPAIDSASAIRSAQAALAATGVAWEVGPPTATLMQTHEPPTRGSRFWFVTFPRQVNGIPYREQAANFSVESETGAVETFSASFPTPPAAPPRIAISAEQAAAIADVLVAPLKGPPATLQTVQLEAVQPNSFWLPGGSEMDEEAAAVVAWQCRFRMARGTCEVWVDPSSGAVLGGSVARSMGTGVPRAAKGPETLADAAAIRQALQHATTVFIYARSGDRTPLAVLSSQAHPAQFARIRQTSKLHVQGPDAMLAYDGRIEIQTAWKDYAAPFDVGTGKILAKAHAQWATIPGAVTNWLVHLRSEHHGDWPPRVVFRMAPDSHAVASAIQRKVR